MLPIVGVPATIAAGMTHYRDVFCRDAGFEHVSRYVSGLVLSANKTLQGIYAQQVWPAGRQVTRRAMHAAVFEAGWSSAALMQRHRAVIAREHRGRGREVIGVDWTLAHHDRGPQIYGADFSIQCFQPVFMLHPACYPMKALVILELQNPRNASNASG